MGNKKVDLCIKNCNNINEANISIVENKVNIKFGINGTGKSTIAKALEFSVFGASKMEDLMPFKLRKHNPDSLFPSITGNEAISHISIFNDSYIDQFVFSQDELIKNSFEIFIKNADYETKMHEIESIVSEIKDVYKDNENLHLIISDLFELSNSFGKSKSGWSESGSFAKSVGKGNKIENVPKGLESYSEYLKCEQNTKWLKWQISGNDFVNISQNCPYCTSDTTHTKETIKKVGTEYNAKNIEHLAKILDVVERLKEYFSDAAREKIFSITKNKSAISEEEKNYLVEVRNQIETLNGKLVAMQGITFFSFKDVEKVVDKITQLKIDLSTLNHLDSEKMRSIVGPLNSSLDGVLEKAGKLQGEINKQKKGIRDTIEKHKGEINEFLRFAGYKYSVNLEGNEEEYKLVLIHQENSESTLHGGLHLSYGERNAFALVLFMYECLSKQPDLIVLDDPISSFDKNKKYAIIEMLFRGQTSLKGKTVLMLTHDLEPIIDVIKNLSHIFEPIPCASFLKLRNGLIEEVPIKKSDIQTFSQVCMENVASSSEDIVKIIYLRRFYEIIDDKGLEYDMISSLLHKKDSPDKKDSEGNFIGFNSEEIQLATKSIQGHIDDFSYNGLLGRMNDDLEMKRVYLSCRSDYEKLQIFRIITGAHENNVIKKFINEVFHIENEYVCQLNPCKYEIVPEYIVRECDDYLEFAEA